MTFDTDTAQVWPDVADSFDFDGALQDILVDGTTLDGWDQFLALIPTRIGELSRRGARHTPDAFPRLLLAD